MSRRDALLAAALVAAIFAGGAFGHWRAERAKAWAVRARLDAALARGEAVEIPIAKRKPRDPNRPRLLRHYKDGRLVGQELEDPRTGTRTALALDAPDPRPKED